MLQVTKLAFDYWDAPLFEKINVSLGPGEVLHVKGANGSGKTTLLKLLAGLLYPCEGQIERTEKLVYLGHKTGVNTRLTPCEHMRFDLGVNNRRVMDDALVRFALQDVQDLPLGLLSAGQRRRVGLLQFLISEAKLWLMDEPLVALDEAGMQVLGSLMQAHVKQGGSIIFTSHQALPFDLGTLQELQL